ncbi:hypothetical protein [Rhizobium leguminosarum]|uniref:hypothetical protein n=1 Tax=Rhizobium leguminosarum TaxID=384 RepID=UPI003F99B21E
MAVLVEPFRLALFRVIVVIAEEQTISIMERETAVAVSAKMAGSAEMMRSEAAIGEIAAAHMRTTAEVAAVPRETATAMVSAAVSQGRCCRCKGGGGKRQRNNSCCYDIAERKHGLILSRQLFVSRKGYVGSEGGVA